MLLKNAVLLVVVVWGTDGDPLWARAGLFGFVGLAWMSRAARYADDLMRPAFLLLAGAAIPALLLAPNHAIVLLLALGMATLLARVQLAPSHPEEGDPAAAWARAHRDQYRGHGSGRPIRRLPVYDPFGGILSGRHHAETDPYEDVDVRYTTEVDEQGRPR